MATLQRCVCAIGCFAAIVDEALSLAWVAQIRAPLPRVLGFKASRAARRKSKLIV